MKRITLILILFLFLTGCEKEVSSLQDRNGIKYEINNEVGFTGRLVEKDEDGQKKAEGNYKDGKREGLLIEWDENGEIQSALTYISGEIVK